MILVRPKYESLEMGQLFFEGVGAGYQIGSAVCEILNEVGERIYFSCLLQILWFKSA
jgi:hypothetical protein